MPTGAILLYDGECGFCDRTVQKVLKRDRKKLFRFAPLQSEFAKDALKRHGLGDPDMSTMVVILDPGEPTERILLRGKGALTVYALLGGLWSVPALLRFLPRGLLDFGYNLIARNRYRIGGRLASCRIPSPEQRSRFLGLPE